MAATFGLESGWAVVLRAVCRGGCDDARENGRAAILLAVCRAGRNFPPGEWFAGFGGGSARWGRRGASKMRRGAGWLEGVTESFEVVGEAGFGQGSTFVAVHRAVSAVGVAGGVDVPNVEVPADAEAAEQIVEILVD